MDKVFRRHLLAIAGMLAALPAVCRAADVEQNSPAGLPPAVLQLSIFNPWQLVDEKRSVKGLRLNVLYAKNAEVSGIDLGLGANLSIGGVTGLQAAGIFNGSLGETAGVQLAILGNFSGPLSGVQVTAGVNAVGGDSKGIQASALVNLYTGTMTGLQVALVNSMVPYEVDRSGVTGVQLGFIANGAGSMSGVQFGAINAAMQMRGVQIGMVNNNIIVPFPTAKSFTGVQVGFINYAQHVRGLQLGLLNGCHTIDGVQLGLLNVATESRLPYLPLMRASF